MSVFYFLVLTSLLLVVIGGIGFFWALRRGQYDDLKADGQRILMEDDTQPAPRRKRFKD